MRVSSRWCHLRSSPTWGARTPPPRTRSRPTALSWSTGGWTVATPRWKATSGSSWDRPRPYTRAPNTGGNNADDSAIDSLRRISGSVRISAHVAAVSANKQDAIVRRGSDDAAVAALWAGVTLIPDEVTGAKTGKIILTAVLQAAFKVTRTAGFSRIQVQHA